MKYNVQKKLVDDVNFVFVTKGKAKPFTEEEMDMFIEEVTSSVEKPKDFRIDESLHNIFMRDLRYGIGFCCNKYGATSDEIIAEAKRIAPHMGRFKE